MKINIHAVSDLGRIVRASRKSQNLRLDDVAGSAKVSPVFVGDAEHGKDSVQLGRVLQVLRELGIRMTVEVPDSVQPFLDKIEAKGMRPPRKRPAGKRASERSSSPA